MRASVKSILEQDFISKIDKAIVFVRMFAQFLDHLFTKLLLHVTDRRRTVVNMQICTRVKFP